MRKRRLLLADDSVTIQKVVNLTFANEDIEVVAVGDGDAAMLEFAAAEPDLVLADVNMPGLDGYQICERIKQNQATKNIPVVLLVGSFEPFDEEKARRVGADDFLTKPFQSIRQLIIKVSDLLDAKSKEENVPTFDADSPTVNSFDDSLKNEAVTETDSAAHTTDDLGDAGLDDAMIETAQIGSLPVDEVRKFESAPVNDYSAQRFDKPALEQSGDFSSADELEKDAGWIETQSLNKVDLRSDAPDAAAAIGENLYEFDGKREFNEESSANGAPPLYPHETKITQTFSSSQITSDLDFEDFDLLNFPQIKKTETVFAEDSSADFQKAKREEEEAPVEIAGEKDENPTALLQAETLSPAMIEAIADRVVEKLSNKVVKQIVREVLNQMEKKR